MNTTRRKPRDEPDEAAQHVLVIGGSQFGRAVAGHLTEDAQSVTFVSEDQPTDVPDDVTPIYHTLSDTNDLRFLASAVTNVDLVVVVGSDSRALLLGHLARREFNPRRIVAGISNPANDTAFERTDVDCIDMSRLLAEQIRDQYK